MEVLRARVGTKRTLNKGGQVRVIDVLMCVFLAGDFSLRVRVVYD